MSALRKLDADSQQAHCPRDLFFVRTIQYFLNRRRQSAPIPCLPARSHSCVSGHRFTSSHVSTGSSPLRGIMSFALFGPPKPAFQRTQKLATRWKGTKTRLNLHTRHAPPAASF